MGKIAGNLQIKPVDKIVQISICKLEIFKSNLLTKNFDETLRLTLL